MTQFQPSISDRNSLWLFLAAFLLLHSPTVAQDLFPDYAPIYKDVVVARVDIMLPPDSLAIILAPGNELSDYHFHATFSFDNGTLRDTLENVGFRLRGNTSRYSAKKSFKVSLNTYMSGRTWHGVEKLNLNGEHNDPSVARSKICWDMLRSIGVPAPRANHVRLYINGDYYGVYANIEHIDEEFAGTRFGNKDGNLYKCLWPADLAYLGSDPDLYKLMSGDRRVYELKTNEEVDDYSDLAHFIDVLNNTPTNDLRCELESIFNINSFLVSMAFDILSGNWDGPLYNKNNFYLYHNEATGQFEYIPYDLDNTFGIDWFGISWATRDIYSWGHHGEPRPIYWRILEVPEYRDRLSFYLNKIVSEFYKEAVLFSRIDTLKALIAPAVAEDPYYPLDYGFTVQDFNNSFGQSLPYFHTPVGVKPFIASRRSATIMQLQLHDIAPIIRYVSTNHPTSTENIAIQASVEDDQGIAGIEVCYQVDGQGDVTCVEMYDDGLHLDDAAGDGRYGAVIPALGTSAILSYYIQATDLNSNVSEEPVCGMHQFSVGSSTISLAVNEFMASNDTTIVDNAGEYEDWVEIYNYGDESVYLGDRYLSDDQGNPTKWQFPDMWIQPDAYVLVWADDDGDQGDLHASFKLGAGGEFVGIFDNDTSANALIDGLDFGPQETDQAFGRLPNGTGPFQIVKATPGSANEAISAIGTIGGLAFEYEIYPNPVRDVLYLRTDQQFLKPVDVLMFNVLGQPVLQAKWQDQWEIDMSELPGGLYTLGVRDGTKIRMLGKVVKE